MINQDKWINSIPKINNKFDEKIKQLDLMKKINNKIKRNLQVNKASHFFWGAFILLIGFFLCI